MVPPLKLSRFLSPGDDARLVLDAAALLDVREFDFFGLAHDWWFGTRAEIKALERVYVPYMFREIVPLWVRQYAREVMIEARAARPDFLRLGLAEVRQVVSPPRNGKLIVALTFAVFALIYAALLDTVANRPASAMAEPASRGEVALSCQGGGPGLSFFESLAYAISDRTPPSC
jgi:hypothetical protein